MDQVHPRHMSVWLCIGLDLKDCSRACIFPHVAFQAWQTCASALHSSTPNNPNERPCPPLFSAPHPFPPKVHFQSPEQFGAETNSGTSYTLSSPPISLDTPHCLNRVG